jgi:hypothetical protein
MFQPLSMLPPQEALQWVLDGFDATVVAFGESGTGKTACLFGDGQAADSPCPMALLPWTLLQLHQRGVLAHGGDYDVGIACWELLQGRCAELGDARLID